VAIYVNACDRVCVVVGVTCIDCGREFTRERLYKGYYCEDCREAYTRE